jgi:Lon protease-like protein
VPHHRALDAVLQERRQHLAARVQHFGEVRDPEVGGGEKRRSIGTIASVTDIGTLDEFYGVQSFGSKRFRVNAWLPDDPYPIADIDLLPDLMWQDSLMPARLHLETKVRQLLALASEFGDLPYGADTELSDDPIDACWQLAGVLPVGPLDQLDLLESQSAEELMSRTLQIVITAEKTLKAMMSQLGTEPGEL